MSVYVKLKLPSSAPELARVPLRSFGAAAHIRFPYVTLTICSHRLLDVSQVEPAVKVLLNCADLERAGSYPRGFGLR